MIETCRLKNVVILIQIIKMKMDAPQPEAQVEIDPDLLALSNFEKEKLIHNYYSDMKSRGRGKFDIFFFFYNYYAAAIYVERICETYLDAG